MTNLDIANLAFQVSEIDTYDKSRKRGDAPDAAHNRDFVEHQSERGVEARTGGGDGVKILPRYARKD
jgi:hypothetical protein